jgi:hypothetical protein
VGGGGSLIMHLHLQLLLVVALCCRASAAPVRTGTGGVSPAAAGPACRFSFQEGFCGAGAPVISATKGVTPTDCCAKCTADKTCKSWTVNNQSSAGLQSTCYLKAFAPNPTIGHNATGCTSGSDPYVPPLPPPPPPPAPPGALNVLFIAVDDLRPELGVYDWKHAPKTPNLDKFAESALVFKNAYIQYSFCCPSR